MIKSKEDLKFYLEADRLALDIKYRRPKLFGNEIWKYQILLRKIEFLSNRKKNVVSKLIYRILYFRYHYLGLILGFTIPPNVFGPGLNIHHYGYIVVNANARVGKNCCIQQGVNIGQNYYSDVPIIGDNVYIGPGAKIFGDIFIADNIAIGANSVVNKSFIEPNITIAGIPAKKIGDRGSEGLLIRGTDYKDNKEYSIL